jgi:predicted MFS family arabinose efflux permease
VAVAVVGSVFAHQGGWDEILFVLAPLAILAGLLVMARRRLDNLDDDPEEPDATDRARTEAGGPGPT